MKIKTKKQMYIGELLEYIRRNNVRAQSFRVHDTSRYIKVHENANLYFDIDFYFRPDDTFTVTVEGELTEDTVISGMTGVYYDRQRKELDLTVMQRTAIKYQLGDDVEDILLAIYVGPTLIWSKEQGIPESGVLEVSE